MSPSSLWSSQLKAPYATNEWWEDAVLDHGGNPITPEPLQVMLQADGIQMGLNPKVVAPNTYYIFKVFRYGLKLSFGDPEAVSHSVVGYDAMSVTAQYTNSKSKAPIATLPIVRGSPYVTAIYKDTATVTVNFVGCALLGIQSNVKKSKKAPPSNLIKGTLFTVHLNTTQAWLIHTSEEVTFKWDSRQLVSTTAVKPGFIIRLSALPFTTPSHAQTAHQVLTKYAGCVPHGGTVDVDTDETHVISKILWKATGPAGKPCAPLIVAMPHMQNVLSKKLHIFTGVEYDGLLGPLIGIASSSWVWRMQFTNISWTAPEPLSASFKATLKEQVPKDVKKVGFAPEPYAFGKQVCRYARLSLLAEELGLDEAMAKADASIKDGFSGWFEDGMDTVVYDGTWFGAVPANGLTDAGADFGAGWYNDHHFHYGYWLYAAAVVAKHDPEWAKKYEPHFTALARDIANPSGEDSHFPVYRYFDWYAGHSWASGLMGFVNGRNQESTSEAINAWYGMQLYGEAVGNNNLKQTGRVLLAHELEAARVYWRATDSQMIYPYEFARHKGAGMVWGDKVEQGTWFGAGPVYALAINIMPYTPITEAYLRKDWLRETIPVLKQALTEGNYLDDWRVIVYMAQAVIDPEAAWTALQSVTVRSDEGMTLSNVLWWVGTRPSPDSPDLPLPEPMHSLPANHVQSPNPSAPSSTAQEAPVGGKGLGKQEEPKKHKKGRGWLWFGLLALGIGLAAGYYQYFGGSLRFEEHVQLVASNEKETSQF
jgi:endo-1,3(4)-beta-glucanase